MKKYIPILEKTTLFSGISKEEISAMLGCLQAKTRSYKKGEFVIREDDSPESIMILLKGKLHIQRDDYWGNRSIISMVGPSDMFGESYSVPDGETFMNDVLAVEDSEVIFFDVKKVINVCSSSCRFHTLVVQNLFSAISEKNIKLMQKLGFISRRTTRDKLIAYLSYEAKKSGSGSFEIPFNRQQLADFLSVDRSAMSNELCKMRNEGLIEFRKNRFRLFQ